MIKKEKTTITGSTIQEVITLKEENHVFYVSTCGDDKDGIGSETKPFATLDQAILVAMEKYSADESSKIIVTAGKYELDHTISIHDMPKDKDAYIYIQGQGDVIFTGARTWKNWEQDTDNIFKKNWDYRWGIVLNTYQGRVPLPLQYREIGFINNVPLLPVRSYEDLEPGTMFASETEGTLFIYPHSDIMDVNKEVVEISESGHFYMNDGRVLGALFEADNIENLMVENITFEKAAAGISDCAIFHRGKNVCIRNCEFNYSAYGGLRFDWIENGTIENTKACTNGGKGMAVSCGKNIVIKNSETSGNNWFGHPNGWIEWDPSGIKFFCGHEIKLINHKADYNWCTGIWADTDIVDMYIESPIVQNNKHYGIWMEANVGPIVIESGIIQDNGSVGLYNSSTANLILHETSFKRNEGGEIAIGDFNQKGRGPLVSDPDWANDYTNTFGNFETGEGYVSHAVDMQVEHCIFEAKEGIAFPIYRYVTEEDKDSYKPFMETLQARNNHYSHAIPDSAFYIAVSDKTGEYVSSATWFEKIGEIDSVFSNESANYTGKKQVGNELESSDVKLENIIQELKIEVPSAIYEHQTHQISSSIILSDGHILTQQEMEEVTFVYGSSDQEVLTIDENGYMQARKAGKINISVRVRYKNHSKTCVQQVIVPGIISAFDTQNMSPTLDIVQEYSGTITLQPWGCEWMTSGAELVFYGIDFGTNEDASQVLKYKILGHAIGEQMAGGQIEIRVDNRENETIGCVCIRDTSSKEYEKLDELDIKSSQWMEATMKENLTGIHTVYVKFVGVVGNKTHEEMRMGEFYQAEFARE